MNVRSKSKRVSPEAGPRPAAGRGLATRKRLVAGGTRLFAERGLHAVTSHDIAQSAGVAAGTFYLHFPDKHALFREIAFRAVAELQERLDRAARDARSAPESVERRASELLTFAEEQRDLVRILFGPNQESPDLGADLLDHLITWVRRDLLPNFVLVGDTRPFDEEVAAQAIVGMWARLLTWWAESPGRAPRDEVVRTLVRLQISGVGQIE